MPRKRVSSVFTQELGHLGLVAGLLKELEVSRRIDEVLEEKSQLTKHVTAGDCICAMIINGLGFTNNAVYLVSRFFENKPLDRLIRPGVTFEHLNDDVLGKALDTIADYDPTDFFANIVFPICMKRKYRRRVARLDSTTFSVEGSYEGFGDSPDETPQIISVTYGHSKQHRPDLKQVTLSMINSGAGGIPVWAEPLSGNSSDKTSFHETIARVRAFQKSLNDDFEFLWVADSALYSKDNLLKSSCNHHWITRVPETIKEAKELVSLPEEEANWKDVDSNYRISSHTSDYGGTRQRWLLVYSKDAYKREIATLEKKIKKEHESVSKQLWHLSNEAFGCPSDAEKKLAEVVASIKYHKVTHKVHKQAVYKKVGRPKKDEKPESFRYSVTAKIKKDTEGISSIRTTKGRFILATNHLDGRGLSAERILREYKGLSKVERGFRFLKDPMFMMDQLFLTKPNRIAALMSIMALCLFVYSIGEYEMRSFLKDSNKTLPNQLKKEIQNPTLRWVFKLMDGISVVNMQVGKYAQTEVSNLGSLQRRIVEIFGNFAKEIYAF